MRNYEKLVVNDNISVREALGKLEESGEKLLIVCDSHMLLKGVISDGDIRKFILRDGLSTESISDIYNEKPICFTSGFNADDIKRVMIEKNITCVPIIDDGNRLIDVVTWNELFGQKKHFIEESGIDSPVVIMAGGKGTRLAPFTNILPKPLIPINNKPIIELIIEKFKSAGAKEFHITVNYKAEMIKAYFDYTEYNSIINYINEEKFLGTAGSLKLLPDDFPETFFLTNCDILVKANYSDILKQHKASGSDITIIGCNQTITIPYGVIRVSDENCLVRIDEKPKMNFVVNTGMYVLEKEVVRYIKENTQYHITDLINDIKEHGGKVSVYLVDEDSWIDIGQWEEYRKSVDKINEKWDETW